MLGAKGFLENCLNSPCFFSCRGKYLDGFFSKSEYKLKKFFTILSSKEWKLTTIKIPPFNKSFVASVNPKINSVNSWLTKTLIAWKVLVAGFFLYLLKFFLALLTIEASSSEVFIGLIVLCLIILFAIIKT